MSECRFGVVLDFETNVTFLWNESFKKRHPTLQNYDKIKKKTEVSFLEPHVGKICCFEIFVLGALPNIVPLFKLK